MRLKLRSARRAGDHAVALIEHDGEQREFRLPILDEPIHLLMADEELAILVRPFASGEHQVLNAVNALLRDPSLAPLTLEITS